MLRHVDGRTDGRTGEQGFALILAILSLLLLTFLGLTLATTTSTELQIASNYRYSQEALYAAEAGIEAGKVVLRNIQTDWNLILPPDRTLVTPWAFGTTPATPSTAPSSTADAWGNPIRNYENAGCDTWAGVGYGAVLDDNVAGALLLGQAPAGPYQNVNTFKGQTLNGSFTLWVHRDPYPAAAGVFENCFASPANTCLVLVSEGVAPARQAVGTTTAALRQQAGQAIRVLQIKLSRPAGNAGNPCQSQQGQQGISGSGASFASCAVLQGGLTGSLSRAFGGAGAGGLTDKGTQ